MPRVVGTGAQSPPEPGDRVATRSSITEASLRELAATVALGRSDVSPGAARALENLGVAAIPVLRSLLEPSRAEPLGRFLAIGALPHLAHASAAAVGAIETAVMDPEPLVFDRAHRALEARGRGGT